MKTVEVKPGTTEEVHARLTAQAKAMEKLSPNYKVRSPSDKEIEDMLLDTCAKAYESLTAQQKQEFLAHITRREGWSAIQLSREEVFKILAEPIKRVVETLDKARQSN